MSFYFSSPDKAVITNPVSISSTCTIRLPCHWKQCDLPLHLQLLYNANAQYPLTMKLRRPAWIGQTPPRHTVKTQAWLYPDFNCANVHGCECHYIVCDVLLAIRTLHKVWYCSSLSSGLVLLRQREKNVLLLSWRESRFAAQEQTHVAYDTQCTL